MNHLATPNPVQELATQVAKLQSAVLMMCRVEGKRLTATQLAERLGVSSSTLARYRARADFPKRGKDGKWALADIIEWEA